MKNIKYLLKKIFPKLYTIMKIIFNKHELNIKFSGWGMKIEQSPPWMGTVKVPLSINFLKIKKKLIRRIKSNKFILSQFLNEPHINNTQDVIKQLNELDYRHFIIYYATNSSYNNTKSKNIVECGVCDGLTVFFVINIYKKSSKFNAYLYDSWDSMRKKDVVKEKKNLGLYSYLDINNTKKNLIEFKDNTIFNHGYIPEIFKSTSKHPKDISLLHIDLNATKPTIDSLNFFFKKLEVNGIIIFDDYAWDGYEHTRKVIDNFLLNKKGDFLHMPTGQAIFIKK
jgi:hypothetical protein